jgi:hypothetical protein
LFWEASEEVITYLGEVLMFPSLGALFSLLLINILPINLSFLVSKVIVR